MPLFFGLKTLLFELRSLFLKEEGGRVSVRRDWKTNRSSPPPIFDDVLEGEMSTFAKSPLLSLSRTISSHIHELESISETSKAPQRDVGFSYNLQTVVNKSFDIRRCRWKGKGAGAIVL